MKATNKNKNSVSGTKEVISPKRLTKLEQLMSFLPFDFSNKPVVAVFRLDGVIGKVSSMRSGLSLCALNKLIEKMFKLERLDAVCLCVNSPGGSPVQSELIYKNQCNIGKLEKINKKDFSLIEIGSDATWDNSLEKYEFKHLTKVCFNRAYENMLWEISESRKIKA